MFDYIFGTKKHIYKNPEEFLLFIKRMLPRHCNSIPDSLAVTIFREVKKIKGKDIILETGSGASSIAIFLACCLTKKKFISYEQHREAKRNLDFVEKQTKKAITIDEAEKILKLEHEKSHNHEHSSKSNDDTESKKPKKMLKSSQDKKKIRKK